MTLQNFIARLNWRQVLLHSLAFWFFIYAFQTLSYLYDTKLVDIVRSDGQLTDKALIDNGIEMADLTYFVLWTNVSGFIGLLVAFIFSLIISIRNHWFWINSLIAFIVVYLLYKFELMGWTYLKHIFWYPGKMFNITKVEFLFNGIVLLTIGLLIFFLKQSNRFIENRKLATM